MNTTTTVSPEQEPTDPNEILAAIRKIIHESEDRQHKMRARFGLGPEDRLVQIVVAPPVAAVLRENLNDPKTEKILRLDPEQSGESIAIPLYKTDRHLQGNVILLFGTRGNCPEVELLKVVTFKFDNEQQGHA